MIVLEFKLKGKAEQYQIIDEMIRTAQFVRNKTLRYWTENQGVKLVDLYKQCAIMAKEFEWASKLNSTARQASAERAIFAIQRFFANCKAKKPGKKGYPQFKKHTRSVEYKQSGWALSTDKRCLTFKDGFAAGKFKLVGSRDLHFYAPDEIKRIRVVRRADGYYAQFCMVRIFWESVRQNSNRCRSSVYFSGLFQLWQSRQKNAVNSNPYLRLWNDIRSRS
jgi:putative transposase